MDKNVVKRFLKTTGLKDASFAHGLEGGHKGEIDYYLIVWSNDKKLVYPELFEGYRVVRRDIPKAL
jgi:hypothetical protein